MIEEILVGGEEALLVHTEEEFQEAFGRGRTLLPATVELARKMGCPFLQKSSSRWTTKTEDRTPTTPVARSYYKEDNSDYPPTHKVEPFSKKHRH